jgi:hypothetical protein
MFCKGDIIVNTSEEFDGTNGLHQKVLLLEDPEINDGSGTTFLGHVVSVSDYPYVCKVQHIAGDYSGEVVDRYFIYKDSIIISREDLLNPILKKVRFSL